MKQIKYGLEFKSDTPNYYKEKDGRKANTVRVLGYDDKRKEILDRMILRKEYGVRIRIIHKQLPTESFIRTISDVTKYSGWYIVSWGTGRSID